MAFSCPHVGIVIEKETGPLRTPELAFSSENEMQLIVIIPLCVDNKYASRSLRCVKLQIYYYYFCRHDGGITYIPHLVSVVMIMILVMIMAQFILE
jgi:hypothetical protein